MRAETDSPVALPQRHTSMGPEPAPKVVGPLKPPIPLPNRIDTLGETASLATARSCLPSPLKSPTATENGSLLTPKPKFVGGLKFPFPFPNKIDTSPES